MKESQRRQGGDHSELSIVDPYIELEEGATIPVIMANRNATKAVDQAVEAAA